MMDDFIRVICSAAMDYAIPRQQIEAAKRRLLATNSTDDFMQLAQEARELFTDAALTGEGGELLLFLFAEKVLRLPQLFSKMYLKTSERKHYEGSDAIHGGVTSSGGLALYWGEAKMYSDWQKAITRCLEDLAPFLLKKEGRDQRDLKLLRQNIDLSDTALEQALIAYLTPRTPEFGLAEYRGIALVGFSSDTYLSDAGDVTPDSVLASVVKQLTDWSSHAESRITHEKVEKIDIHLFLVPVPDADQFRSLFLAEMGK